MAQAPSARARCGKTLTTTTAFTNWVEIGVTFNVNGSKARFGRGKRLVRDGFSTRNNTVQDTANSNGGQPATRGD